MEAEYRRAGGAVRYNSEYRMIAGTGVDIAEVNRIAKAIERFGRRFVERVYTPGEIRYCESKANAAERFAARFAAKEAAMKAIGTGLRGGVTWRDFEVIREPSGRPSVTFHGRAAQFVQAMQVRKAHLSLSHTAEYAIASVVLES